MGHLDPFFPGAERHRNTGADRHHHRCHSPRGFLQDHAGQNLYGRVGINIRDRHVAGY